MEVEQALAAEAVSNSAAVSKTQNDDDDHDIEVENDGPKTPPRSSDTVLTPNRQFRAVAPPSPAPSVASSAAGELGNYHPHPAFLPFGMPVNNFALPSSTNGGSSEYPSVGYASGGLRGYEPAN